MANDLKPQSTVSIGSLHDSFRVLMRRCSQSPHFYSPTLGKSDRSLLDSLATIRDAREESLVVDHPEIYHLANDVINLLLKLAEASGQADKATLGSLARLNMAPRQEFYSFSGHLYIFLLRSQGEDAAIDSALETIQLDEPSLSLLRAISETLKYDHLRYSDSRLEPLPYSLLRAVDSRISDVLRVRLKYPMYPEHKLGSESQLVLRRITGQCDLLRFSRLKGRLSDTPNLEINQDKLELQAELSRFEFSKDLRELLERVEAEYRSANDKFDYKTSVDLNRSFFEVLLREAAIKIARSRKHVPDPRWSHSQNVRKYLRDQGLLLSRFDELCEKFYQFASEEGTHELSTGREVARVTHNIGIELGLLVVRRLDKLVS